jgi:peroxiredoxin
MRKNIFFLLIAIGLISCNQNDKFKVSGVVTDSNKEVIVLEHTGLLKTTVIDSVELDSDGSFSFKAPRPEYPDFYRLRIGEKQLVFAVDSCETLNIKADIKNFSTGYTVEGSQASSEIQKLRVSLSAIQAKVNEITADMSTDERNARLGVIEKDIETHKDYARKLILQNPRSTSAYFAIYQQINNTYVFSPYVKADKPYCAAVATAFNAFMPEYIRTKNVYALVLDAINKERSAQNAASWREILDNASTGYIDIELNDRAGVTRKLSAFEGKVVLIDFSAYEMENNIAYTFELRELYNKYKNRGFEIYQVSLDRSKLIWEEGAANVPWVSVRDENGPDTKAIASYNVQSIPTMFILDKKGTIVSRPADFKAAEADILKVL